jgi:hypothetical protein
MSDMERGPLPEDGTHAGTGAATLEPEPVTQSSPVAPPPTRPPGTGTSTGEWHDFPHGARRGGITAGIVLIALGVLVLFGRYAPWNYLLQLWPLIILIAGLIEMFTPRREPLVKRLASGFGTVVVGTILLCNTFGVIPWSVWLNMLSLWPLLLVALGIELLGKGLRLDFVRALSNVLLILGLLYGVFVMGPGWHGSFIPFVPVSGEAVTFDQTAPHDATAKGGDASIYVGALRLSVGAGDGLVTMKGNAAKGSEPELSSSVVSGTAEVAVQDPNEGVFVLPYPDRSLSVDLDRAVDWNGLMLKIGAADADVDLRDLHFSSVNASVGASNLRLSIGSRAPKVSVDVSGGATAVTILVPANAAVTVHSSSGLSALNVPDSFDHVSGTAVLGQGEWSKKGSGGPEISITLKSGVSSLDIQTY